MLEILQKEMDKVQEKIKVEKIKLVKAKKINKKYVHVKSKFMKSSSLQINTNYDNVNTLSTIIPSTGDLNLKYIPKSKNYMSVDFNSNLNKNLGFRTPTSFKFSPDLKNNNNNKVFNFTRTNESKDNKYVLNKSDLNSPVLKLHSRPSTNRNREKITNFNDFIDHNQKENGLNLPVITNNITEKIVNLKRNIIMKLYKIILINMENIKIIYG